MHNCGRLQQQNMTLQQAVHLRFSYYYCTYQCYCHMFEKDKLRELFTIAGQPVTVTDECCDQLVCSIYVAIKDTYGITLNAKKMKTSFRQFFTINSKIHY